jgi:hypothetical protein
MNVSFSSICVNFFHIISVTFAYVASVMRVCVVLRTLFLTAMSLLPIDVSSSDESDNVYDSEVERVVRLTVRPGSVTRLDGNGVNSADLAKYKD